PNRETSSKNVTYSWGVMLSAWRALFEKSKPAQKRGHKALVRPPRPADCQVAERIQAMRTFANSVVNFLKREDGPTAVEYAVMLALIIVVCITAITALGTNANKTFTS